MTEDIISKLTAIKDELAANDAEAESLASAMSTLWQTLLAADEPQSRAILNTRIAVELRDFFSPRWAAFITAREKARANISGDLTEPAQSVLAIEAYNGLPAELACLADIAPKSPFVMVGCGPYPETLLMAQRAAGSSLSVVGIDRSADAIATARSFYHRAGLSNAVFIEADGASFNYRGTSLALIANGLAGKHQVLAHMAQTLPSGGRILVRTPVRLGRLLYEDPFENGSIPGFRELRIVASSALGCTHLLEIRP